LACCAISGFWCSIWLRPRRVRSRGWARASRVRRRVWRADFRCVVF